jgi:hypothetical protein
MLLLKYHLGFIFLDKPKGQGANLEAAACGFWESTAYRSQITRDKNG